MKGIVICANSYLQYKNALYIATRNYQKYPITILVPGNDDLFKFFKVINEKLFHNDIKLIYLEAFHPDPRRAEASGLKRIFYILPDIIRQRQHQKKSFNEYLAGIEEADVYFFDRGLNNFPLVKKLRKRNRLIYISSYSVEVTSREYSPASIADWARLMIHKLTYGGGIALGELPYEKGFPHMSAKFLEKEVDRVIDGEERDEMMRDFDLSQFKIFDAGKHHVIYFFDDISAYARDKNTFKRELIEIFDILNKHFPENEIARKYHPNYPMNETWVNIGDVLPDFIPAELLYNENVKIYLSGYSTAIANVEKGLAVSIIDLISFSDEQIRSTLKEIVGRMGHTKILFPKSLQEFEKILVGLRSIGKSNTKGEGTSLPMQRKEIK